MVVVSQRQTSERDFPLHYVTADISCLAVVVKAKGSQIKLPLSGASEPTVNEQTPIVFAAYIVARYQHLPTSASVSRSGHGHVQRSSYQSFQVLLLHFRF